MPWRRRSRPGRRSTEEQVRSLVGAVFFVLAAMYVARTARTALAEARRWTPQAAVVGGRGGRGMVCVAGA
jgi:hypothetical protein